MIRIGNVELGLIPRIVIGLNDVVNPNLIEEARLAGVDILEIRIDQFKSLDSDYVTKILKSIKNRTLPIIGTIRTRNEAGQTQRIIKDKKRLILYKDIIPFVDAIDIELQSKSILNKAVKEAHKNKKIVIISYHNFKETPSEQELGDLILKAKSHGADIVKIATFAKSRNDVIRLLNITQKNKAKNLITISLGSIGAISRVFFPFAGSLLIYSCIDTPSSPGQIQVSTLLDELRLFYPDFNEAIIKRLKILEDA